VTPRALPVPARDPGTVNGLRIVDGSWEFGSVEVECSVLQWWEAKIVTIDANYQVTGTVRNLPCTT
jgi:hypothetical protein